MRTGIHTLGRALAFAAGIGLSLAHAQSCVAPAAWFPLTPKPANQQPATLCDFYLWSWQTFLYITQANATSGDNRPRFLTYDTPADLFGPTAALRFPPSGRLPGAAQSLLRLAPRITKQEDPVDIDQILQAGSGGILVDQVGHAVYYQIHLNEDFSKFVKDSGLADPENLKRPDLDPPCPVGAIELKSSWRVLAAGEDPKGAFTTLAEVPRLINKNGKIVIDPTQISRETVALVGLHVVGKTQGHPEFIWTTFEHVENTPDLPPRMKPNADAPVDNARSWTFYPRGSKAKDSNKNVKVPELKLDEATQTLTPKNAVFREFALGGSDNPALITGLTSSVRKQLPITLDVWKNYFLVGAVWLKNPGQDFKPGEQFDAGKLAGEKKLSNSTMETFTQSETLRSNCFSCHNTEAVRIPGTTDEIPAKLLNVSHVFSNAFSNIRQVIQRAIDSR
jgi:hypothetical protein